MNLKGNVTQLMLVLSLVRYKLRVYNENKLILSTILKMARFSAFRFVVLLMTWQTFATFTLGEKLPKEFDVRFV